MTFDEHYFDEFNKPPKRVKDDTKVMHWCGCWTRRCYDMDAEKWAWALILCPTHKMIEKTHSIMYESHVHEITMGHRTLLETRSFEEAGNPLMFGEEPNEKNI